MAKTLYLSLTGMTEPLGRSQVLEYLMDLSKENAIYLLSFERENDLKNVDEIQALIKDQNIQWHYLTYSNKYGVFSTLWQLVQAIRLGSKTIHEHSIDIVHARSMIPATIGLVLKKLYGVKLLFDIRGFAIDEKVDTGRLQRSSLLYKLLKRLDDHLYKVSDHIVTLTHTAKEILHQSLDIPKEKITVIPTCASKELFKLLNEDEKRVFKSTLGYAEKDKIVVHTGTVSGWYDFEAEVRLVKAMINQDEDVRFLVLNKNEHPFVEKILEKYSLERERVKVASCSFNEMYKYLNIADASLFFIKPSFSKQASAPTKFAENVVCRLPSVTNSGVGDMGFYLEQYKVGMAVDLDTLDANLEKVAADVIGLMKSGAVDEDDFS
uniref:glycosyltransferase n=1 Tax=Sulfurovum sp. TaxID=1969726 RepID=UPI0035656F01